MKVNAYAAYEQGKPLEPFQYELGPLGDLEVDIKVEYCGICYSDISMLDNEWECTTYPIVPGHEIIGKVNAVGDKVEHLAVGQRVGVGWNADSCMSCEWCTGGDHNLCSSAQGVIVGHHGGFADKVRAAATWAIPIPDGIDPKVAGPLLCGGITVFNPLVLFDVKPTSRVGVIGIGGLGHMAIKFMSAYGCEVTAFSSSPDKEAEARSFGADHYVDSTDSAALEALAGSLDFIISTVNVPLDWGAYVNALRPKGRFHIAGAVMEPMSLSAFPLIVGQRSISGSPTGSPVAIARMLDFAARQKVEPMVEVFPLSQVNEALDKLRNGKPRYRIVLSSE